MAGSASVTRNLSFRFVDFPESEYTVLHGIAEVLPAIGTKAMNGVNLDLLNTTPHHADGRRRDPHAHHTAEHRACLRAAHRERWQRRLRWLTRLGVLLPARKAQKPLQAGTCAGPQT